MTYTQLFGLSLKHPYYSDGVCPDFAIEPASSTLGLLAKYRCVLKSGPGWVRAFNDPTLLCPDKGDTFTFRLRLKNPNFRVFTDTSDYDAVKLRPVYTNAPPAPAGPLTLTSRAEWQHERFAWGPGGGAGRFKLGGRPLAGAANQMKVDGAGTSATVAYDETENAVAISAATVKTGDLVTIGYYAQPAPRRDRFADAEIVVGIDPAVIQQQGMGSFQIAFKEKSAWWAYYLVTDPKNNVGDFKIVEKLADSALPPGFANSAPRDLGAAPDPKDPIQKDPIAGQLATLYPTARRIRFLSDILLPCRQSAGRSVQLLFGGNPLAAPLPNPPSAQFTTFADHDGDLFYQIVRT